MDNIIDPYLDDGMCIRRLQEEWDKYGMLVLAVDFDNTLFDYYKRGYTFPLVIDAIREAKRHGFHITIFTSCDESRFPEIKDYLAKEDIPYNSINETPDFIPFKGRKVYYNLFLDDRAGLSSSYHQLKAVFSYIRGTKAMQGIQEIG